eukprot:CAMPEP_0196144522 /NCGR_PEP_ID=MMETSP0910-20130528/16727_1 /TAXON_ID=49265 /ORGANISM="Thalassiosira rotula, Strain GSO102" /LENGTH=136 /DNA_ID=CAMNT_0041406191 /DNA_START=38 /DNA_END=448 /DNA_ORIENTATION=-
MPTEASALSLPLTIVAVVAATWIYNHCNNLLFGSGGGGGDSDGDDDHPSNDVAVASADQSELQNRIRALTEKNQELEANVASLSEKTIKLEARLAEEIKRKTNRRTTNRSKLANMSAKLKAEFGDDFVIPPKSVSP